MDKMIIIDDILISDEIIKEEFICNLTKCKGGCCVDGDAGAPLAKDELKKIKEVYKIIKDELSAEAMQEIKKAGPYTTEEYFGYVTPAINGGICVYGYQDEATGIYDNVTAKFAKNFANRYVPEADPDSLSNFAESHVVCWNDAPFKTPKGVCTVATLKTGVVH